MLSLAQATLLTTDARGEARVPRIGFLEKARLRDLGRLCRRHSLVGSRAFCLPRNALFQLPSEPPHSPGSIRRSIRDCMWFREPKQVAAGAVENSCNRNRGANRYKDSNHSSADNNIHRRLGRIRATEPKLY